MVGGIIEDFCVLKHGSMNAEVKFLVLDDNDYCTVKARIDNTAFKQIKKGQSIWWHSPYVYLEINGVKDVKFTKIGASGGNKNSYYQIK